MDPASISILAANVVTVITPFLANAAEAIVPQAAEYLYQAIKARFAAKPAAAEALHDLETAPKDEDFQASVRAQLKKIMAEDPQFAEGLSQRYQKLEAQVNQQSVSASDRSVAAGRDIRGPVFTGDVGGDISIRSESNS